MPKNRHTFARDLSLAAFMIKAEHLRLEGMKLAQQREHLAKVSRVVRAEARRIRSAFPIEALQEEARRNWKETEGILGQPHPAAGWSP